jgi:imidazolonepropionase-like amidohydrolase
MVRVAAQQGKKVMVHANGQLPVRQALEADCHSIEHGFFMGRENLERMAEKQIVWGPTTYAMKICAENIGKEDIYFDQGVAEKTLHHQLEQIAFARKSGVPITLGTDAGSKGVLHGDSVVEEMKLLIKARHSLTEAIQCATYNGAKLLGIDNEMGLIAKGKPANLLVARGTPSQLPRKVLHLEAIYLCGTAPAVKNISENFSPSATQDRSSSPAQDPIQPSFISRLYYNFHNHRRTLDTDIGCQIPQICFHCTKNSLNMVRKYQIFS